MLRRISVVLISALLMMGFTTSVAWADQPPNKGQGGATENKRTGAPDNPNGFGTVTSQLGTALGGVGSHTSGSPPARTRTPSRPSAWAWATSPAMTAGGGRPRQHRRPPR